MKPSDLRALVELAEQPNEAPRDSIEGAVQSLFHGVIDGIVNVVPQRMKVSSTVERSQHPVKIELKGTNSQGLNSALIVAVDMGEGFSSIVAKVRYALINGAGQPIASKGGQFHCGPKDSVKIIVKQFQAWLKQEESLSTAPVGPQTGPVAG